MHISFEQAVCHCTVSKHWLCHCRLQCSGAVVGSAPGQQAGRACGCSACDNVTYALLLHAVVCTPSADATQAQVENKHTLPASVNHGLQATGGAARHTNTVLDVHPPVTGGCTSLLHPAPSRCRLHTVGLLRMAEPGEPRAAGAAAGGPCCSCCTGLARLHRLPPEYAAACGAAWCAELAGDACRAAAGCLAAAGLAGMAGAGGVL